jgi:site-specific recombinase XerD
MNIPKHIEDFRNEIIRKGYREQSIKNYVSCVTKFLHHFDTKFTEPIKINESAIKDYLRSFTDHNTQRSVHSAIKCFYHYSMNQPDKFKYIEYCKRSRKLPIVLSQDEVKKMIEATDNLKHRCIMYLMYATGIRVSETINLKIKDIDSSRMVINILNAKGGKDRQVMLPEKLLLKLREYFLKYRPKEHLFEGQFGGQYSQRSISQILKQCADKCGLGKRVYPHLMRHCSFTHLVESGTDINLVQRLAGHSSVKTTNLYLQISHNLISSINSPVNAIL